LVKAQQKLVDEDLQRPLRIRGHLFFDASHGLCKRKRRNIWQSSTAIRMGDSSRLQH
jgi:hypothetical protein